MNQDNATNCISTVALENILKREIRQTFHFDGRQNAEPYQILHVRAPSLYNTINAHRIGFVDIIRDEENIHVPLRGRLPQRLSAFKVTYHPKTDKLEYTAWMPKSDFNADWDYSLLELGDLVDMFIEADLMDAWHHVGQTYQHLPLEERQKKGEEYHNLAVTFAEEHLGYPISERFIDK